MESSSPPKVGAVLAKHFETLHDPRVARGRLHPLLNVVVIALLGVICGAEGWDELEVFGESKESWLKTFLDLTHGTPSADTFRRVFEALRPSEFATCMQSFVRELAGPLGGKVVSLDGKSLRGALARGFGRTALHAVHVWAGEQRLLLGIEMVEGAGQEREAIERLLPQIDLQDAVVTFDAGNVSTAVLEAVTAANARYVATLKGNQPTACAEVRTYFEEADHGASSKGIRHLAESDRGHGRDELREVWVAPARKVPSLVARWPSAEMIAQVRRTRVLAGGEVQIATHWYVGSVAPKVRDVARAIRAHWSVENGLHWILDVQLREDECPIRHEHGAANFALLRRIAIMLLKRNTTLKRGVKGKQKAAGWDHEFLLHTLTRGLPENEGN